MKYGVSSYVSIPYLSFILYETDNFSATDEKTKKNEALATAILKDKHKPNRLVVEQSPKDDNSVVALSQVCCNFSFYKFMVSFTENPPFEI